MEIKLNKLSIKNFAGIKEESFNFNGSNARVYGDNATGKTTTAVALNWLLFGKNLEGKQVENVVPQDSTGEEIYELVPTVEAVFDIDGKQVTYTKENHPVTQKNEYGQTEYKSSRRTKQYINEVPFKITDFNKAIEALIDENVFKMITNVNTFANLNWKDKRELLFSISGEVTDQDVVTSNKELEPLLEIISNNSLDEEKKKLQAQLKKSKEDLEHVPIRIDTLYSQLPKESDKDLTVDISKVEKEIDELKEKMTSIKNGGAAIGIKNDIQELQNKLKQLEIDTNQESKNKIHSLQSELNLYESDILNVQNRIKQVKQQTDELQQSVTHQRNEWMELNKKRNTLEVEKFQETELKNTCVCCGQELPEDEIEKAHEMALTRFNEEKSKRLERYRNEMDTVAQRGKQLSESVEANKKHIAKLEVDLQKLKEEERIKQTQLEKLKESVTDVRELDEYKSIVSEIETLENQLNNESDTVDTSVQEIQLEIDELNSKLRDLRSKEAENEMAKGMKQEIENLRVQEDSLRSSIENIQYQLYLLDQFTVTKVNLITEKVNSMFKLAKFKMFNKQVNGELKETCEITVDGVSFDKGLNNAARINVGLDIIETISNYYNTFAPIFIDNSESVTEVFETTSQQIKLVVSEDDEQLRMELK